MEDQVCVVTGVGPGNGAALARRFAAGGYRVAMLARSKERLEAFEKEIRGSRGYACDVGDEEAVKRAFGEIRKDLGPVKVLLHNAGSGRFASFDDLEPEDFDGAFRTNALSLLLCGKEAVRDMDQSGGGAIVVTGATASLRGGATFAGFAPAKAAQRSLAQSMARHLGPRGIHVAYVIVDGVIDIPKTRELLPDEPDEFFLKPAAIAETTWHVAHQDRSAWTFEVDLRPFGEKW